MCQKKVLVLGATGAMGKYLIPKLAAQGYQIDAVALDDYDFGCPVNLIKAQAKDFEFRTKLLQNRFYLHLKNSEICVKKEALALNFTAGAK